MVVDLVRMFWQLEREQWLSGERLEELGARRLRRLVADAYARVPYYRRLFDARGLRPTDIATVADLQKLPVLTKKVVQAEGPGQFMALGVDPERCVVRETSGSTGRPFTVRRTEAEEAYAGLLLYRAYLANGYRPWYRQAIIYDQKRIPKVDSWLDWLRRRRRLYLWSGQDVDEQVRAIRAHRPHAIRGYSQSLKLLALAVRRAGITDIGPRVVFGVAELLDASARALIDDVFRVRMVDLYATEEAGFIAWECPAHRGYHLNRDNVIVEFLHEGQPAKPGEPAHVVVTPLYLHTMPLIRYDLGDIATSLDGTCPCGRELPLMEMVQGRADGVIVLRSGTVIPPVGTFAGVLEREPTVVEYLLVQESYDLIVVKVVERTPGGPAMVERVRQGIAEFLRHEAEVRVEVVERIDRGGGAKLRRIISKVPLGF